MTRSGLQGCKVARVRRIPKFVGQHRAIHVVLVQTFLYRIPLDLRAVGPCHDPNGVVADSFARVGEQIGQLARRIVLILTPRRKGALCVSAFRSHRRVFLLGGPIALHDRWRDSVHYSWLSAALVQSPG